MKAKMKCSNCGAEMSNMSMNWGLKQLWVIVPILILGFLPLIRMTLYKGDVTKDLAISEVRTKMVGSSLEVIGLISNSSGREWSGVTIEAEFYDPSGVFLDERTQYLQSTIGGHAKEHFKVTVSSPPELAAEGVIKPTMKISGGHTSPF